MIYDIIIVGGGMAGLYTQNKLIHKYKNILLIEKIIDWAVGFGHMILK